MRRRISRFKRQPALPRVQPVPQPRAQLRRCRTAQTQPADAWPPVTPWMGRLRNLARHRAGAVSSTPLPRRPGQGRADHVRPADVRIGDDQPDAGHAAGDQRAQEDASASRWQVPDIPGAPRYSRPSALATACALGRIHRLIRALHPPIETAVWSIMPRHSYTWRR